MLGAKFKEFLNQTNNDRIIYDAMSKDDLSEVVMTALHIINSADHLSPVLKKTKCNSKSTSYRNLGNDQYQKGYYQRALALYNKALLYATKNSTEMKLAYSNRSALFRSLRVWSACVIDIEKVFSMGCPSDIVDKLYKRKLEVFPNIIDEQVQKNITREVVRNFVDLSKTKYNSQIPCAISDVKIVNSADKRRVVASANIKIGSVVGSETAYVSYTSMPNILVSCFFCQRKSLNLIPCDGCCYALFCDENCKKQCKEEYHEDECEIMEVIGGCCVSPLLNLMVKACFKLKRSCKSWNEFIAASEHMGNDRINSSSVKEIYGSNKYSVLFVNNDKIFVHGQLYNSCFPCAVILYFLDYLMPSYLPMDPLEKDQSRRALARVMMFVALYQKHIHLIQNEHDMKQDISNYKSVENYGIFPFIAKLQNSCDSNLMLAKINNKVVMIAIRPVKKGDELTVPYLWPMHDSPIPKPILNKSSFMQYGIVCGCSRCANDSNDMTNNEQQLSNYQKDVISQLPTKPDHRTILKMLAVLDNVRYSKEYKSFYQVFRTHISVFELFNGGNIVLDDSLPLENRL